MIISRTPYRISFFGGGTDYPEWYEAHGGAVLASSINKYAYILCERTPQYLEYRYRISYRLTEIVDDVDAIEHPAVREALNTVGVPFGIQLHHHGDLPARTGVGSSSAFAVGILNALHQIVGRKLSRAELARAAIELERETLQERVGCQDQFTCALGGLNFIEFGPGHAIAIRPVVPATRVVDEIDQRIVLVYSGEQRDSSDISKPLFEALESKARLLEATHAMALRARAIFEDGTDLDEIGEMLEQSWHIKIGLNDRALTPALKDLHDRGLASGALGAKILGAGGGGFLMFWLARDQRGRFLRAMDNCAVVPVALETDGTTILFADHAVTQSRDAEAPYRVTHGSSAHSGS